MAHFNRISPISGGCPIQGPVPTFKEEPPGGVRPGSLQSTQGQAKVTNPRLSLCLMICWHQVLPPTSLARWPKQRVPLS